MKYRVLSKYVHVMLMQYFSADCYSNNSLQHIFTTMIGFVTWPPFFVPSILYKGEQVTKPIIVVKICCKLLYVIQVRT